MRYTFKSLTKFVEIVTAPESKSQLEVLFWGQPKEIKDIVSLSNQLTHMAESRGHKLVVRPACLNTECNEIRDLDRKQQLEAVRMPKPLLYGNM